MHTTHHPDAPSALLELTSATFDEEVLGADRPVVVDVWTEWCGPCRTIRPILEDLSRELEGKVRFAGVDAEAEPALAARFQVMSFPTLLIFEGGALVKRLIGARGRNHLLEELAAWV